MNLSPAPISTEVLLAIKLAPRDNVLPARLFAVNVPLSNALRGAAVVPVTPCVELAVSTSLFIT